MQSSMDNLVGEFHYCTAIDIQHMAVLAVPRKLKHRSFARELVALHCAALHQLQQYAVDRPEADRLTPAA